MRTIGSTVNCAPVGLPFVYDTGAEIMSINQADVDQMKQISAIEPTDLGSIQLMTCNGVVSRRVVEIEVSIRDHNWVFMCPFFKILATVNPDNSADRLTGPWMRYVLFSATTPDAPNLYLADNKRELIQYLPPWNTPSTGP
jgi:hypothetical protein